MLMKGYLEATYLTFFFCFLVITAIEASAPSVTYHVKRVRVPGGISASPVQEAGSWRPASAIPNVRKVSSSPALVVRSVIIIAARAKVRWPWLIARAIWSDLHFLFQCFGWQTSGEGPLECTSCPPHSMLEGGLCMECLGAQYYDSLTQLCKSCHSDCRRCTGPGKFSCAACSPPLHLDKLNNQCVPCCTGNEKGAEAEECCLCDPETGNFHACLLILCDVCTKKKKKKKQYDRLLVCRRIIICYLPIYLLK